MPVPYQAPVVKLARKKTRIRYVCDTSKSFICYTTRDREEKSNTPMHVIQKGQSVRKYNKRIA